MAHEKTVIAWRMCLKTKPWVLFKNGTVVVVHGIVEENSIKENAINTMKQMGPVFPGTLNMLYTA